MKTEPFVVAGLVALVAFVCALLVFVAGVRYGRREMPAQSHYDFGTMLSEWTPIDYSNPKVNYYYAKFVFKDAEGREIPTSDLKWSTETITVDRVTQPESAVDVAPRFPH